MASCVGRVSGICVAGLLLVVALAIVAFIRLAYEFVVRSGSLSDVIICFHEACMVVNRGVVSEDNF